MAKNYVRQWRAPSRSNPAKTYKVSLTEAGDYECNCPAWKFRSPRRDCHHIKMVQVNPSQMEIDFKAPWPKIILAKVKEVTRKENNELYVPLIPLNTRGFSFTVTVIYDLIKHGVPWSEIKERYGRMIKRGDGSPATKDDIIAWVNNMGRTIIDEFGQAAWAHGEPTAPLHDTYKTLREGLTL